MAIIKNRGRNFVDDKGDLLFDFDYISSDSSDFLPSLADVSFYCGSVGADYYLLHQDKTIYFDDYKKFESYVYDNFSEFEVENRIVANFFNFNGLTEFFKFRR